MSDDLLHRLREVAEVCREGWGFGPAKSEIAALLDDAASRITYLMTEIAVQDAKLGHLLAPTDRKIEWANTPPALPSPSSSLREDGEGKEALHRDGNVIQFIPKGKP